jgi:hypothetical protein
MTSTALTTIPDFFVNDSDANCAIANTALFRAILALVENELDMTVTFSA